MTSVIPQDVHFHVACGILVPRPVIEPGPSSVKARVLTTGPLRVSLNVHYFWGMFFILRCFLSDLRPY